MITKLGHGNFGEVWKGMLDDKSVIGVPEFMVAAKVVLDSKSSDNQAAFAAAQADLTKEALLMAPSARQGAGVARAQQRRVLEHDARRVARALALEQCSGVPSKTPGQGLHVSSAQHRPVLVLKMFVRTFSSMPSLHQPSAAHNPLHVAAKHRQ